ncbi:MAG: hypothetical protein U9O06_13325 [Euryarchaeota archaeon]|nr:hypothetical protein [Euryarchaeota archaeon]
MAGSLWFERYVPLAVLIVGLLGYIAYSFVQDLDIFLQWVWD